MSLFSDILNSIGSDKSPAPPKPPARPLSANALRPSSDVSKPASRPGMPATSSIMNGIKRKAENGSPNQPEKLMKPNPPAVTNNRVTHRPAAPPLNAPKPSNEKIAPLPRPKLEAITSVPARTNSAPTTPTTAIPSKAPAKGSYAELMARAKAQTDKGQTNQVGMIKHQATHRERVSKVAERKRQEEDKAKAAKEKITNGRSTVSNRQQPKSRSVSPAKRTDQAKVAKAPRPPLHAPPSSSYKGTMGMTSGRTSKPAPRRRRQDEYLDTDEEDVSDDMGGYGEDEEGDYASEASSDMEAGLDDMDAEEQRALKLAKEEDARELALETQLKRDKDAKRRQALQALADKRKK